MASCELTVWQAVALICFTAFTCVGAAGGVHYLMFNRKGKDD